VKKDFVPRRTTLKKGSHCGEGEEGGVIGWEKERGENKENRKNSKGLFIAGRGGGKVQQMRKKGVGRKREGAFVVLRGGRKSLSHRDERTENTNTIPPRKNREITR